jgi:hypothetical protein
VYHQVPRWWGGDEMRVMSNLGVANLGVANLGVANLTD